MPHLPTGKLHILSSPFLILFPLILPLILQIRLRTDKQVSARKLRKILPPGLLGVPSTPSTMWEKRLN